MSPGDGRPDACAIGASAPRPRLLLDPRHGRRRGLLPRRRGADPASVVTATSGRSSKRDRSVWRCTAPTNARAASATAVFRVDDLDGTRWLLEQRGASFDEFVGEVEGFARFATFRDPDGNPVQIIEYPPGRVTEPCPRMPAPRCRPGANFCPNCGAPVGVAPASERRVVTVVFVDLAGSTELAARLDPERFREVLAAFHGMVTDEITALRGPSRGLHRRRGARGVRRSRCSMTTTRCAASVRGWRSWTGPSGSAPRLGLPMPVQVRVGVNTGQVAVGTAMDRNIVIGAEVNIGARIQQAAEPGEVLVGASTKQLRGQRRGLRPGAVGAGQGDRRRAGHLAGPVVGAALPPGGPCTW